MLHPGLPDLFESLTSLDGFDSIEVHRNDGMVGVRQHEPVQGAVALVTRRRSDGQSDGTGSDVADATELSATNQIADNDGGSG